MTEIEAAIAREQLKKLKSMVVKRKSNVEYLTAKLKKIPFIKPGEVRIGASHVYYVQPFVFDVKKAGVPRDEFIAAVKAELPVTRNREKEGVKITSGYVKPIYLLPLFQKRICLGRRGFPFSLYKKDIKKLYQRGVCPVMERLQHDSLFIHDLMHAGMSKKDLDDVAKAFVKVAQNLNQLKK